MAAEPLADAEPPDDRLVWTMDQLLERLPVSRSTVYRWIESEALPVVRIDERSRPLFLPQSVLAWFESREQQKTVHAHGGPARDARMDTLRLAQTHGAARRTRSRRVPPPPIAAAGTRERLRRIRGAH